MWHSSTSSVLVQLPVLANRVMIVLSTPSAFERGRVEAHSAERMYT